MNNFVGHCDRRLRDWIYGRINLSDDSVSRIALDSFGNFGGFKFDTLGNLTILTDHSGSHPVYYGKSGSCISAGFDPISVACQLGFRNLDEVSAADFLTNGTVCFPYTLIQGLRLAYPGSITRISENSTSVRNYFTPDEVDVSGNEKDWGRRLKDLLQRAISFGLRECSDASVLFSGGEDARIVAGYVSSDVALNLYTVADSNNREVKLARRAAKKIGRNFHFIQRPAQFYRRNFRDRVINTGGHFDIRHTHIWGEMAKPLSKSDAIMGGYGADVLFKSQSMANVSYSKMDPFRKERLGKMSSGAPYGVRLSDPLETLNRELVACFTERRLRHHYNLQQFRPETAANWHTLWPLGAHRTAFAHVLALRKIGPRVIEPFLDGQLYKLATRIPDCYRIDRRAFMRLHFGPEETAKFYLTSSGRIPCINGHAGAAISKIVNSGRRFMDSIQGSVAFLRGKNIESQGPWGSEHISFNVSISDFVDEDEFFDLIRRVGYISSLHKFRQDERSKQLEIAKIRGIQLILLQRELRTATDCVYENYQGNRVWLSALGSVLSSH